MAYLGQFDSLIRAEERGRAITSTRTIAVFDDGLVVCPVGVYGDGPAPAGGVLGALLGGGRPRSRGAGLSNRGRPDRATGPGRGAEQIRAGAQAAGSGSAFAEAWPKAQLVPFAVVDTIVLTRPRQVSELAVCVQGAGSQETTRYLGDLSQQHVRDVLAAALGDRLQIDIPKEAPPPA